MNRTLSALFSALEALLVAAIGIAIPLVPLTILWGAQYGFAPDWRIFWRTAADIWMLGHGADLYITLDAATVKASGLAGAGAPFVVSIAALGFALLTVLLAIRAGRRIAETHHRLLGEVVAVVVFALGSLLVAVSAAHPLARVSISQGAAFPTLLFALGLLIAHLGPSERGELDPLRAWVARGNREARAVVGVALRGGAAAAAAVITVACLIVVVLLVANYAQIITLYEDLHSGALGGAALTIAEIMVLPNVVIWAASWIVGPGFALGAGSSISPLATTVGPVPAVPLLGALPHGSPTIGYAIVIVPVIAGFLAGALLRGRLADALGIPLAAGSSRRAVPALWLAVTGLGIGIVGGLVLGILAAVSAGSIGPGRLHTAGPDAVAVAIGAAVEIGLAAVVGLFAMRDRRGARDVSAGR